MSGRPFEIPEPGLIAPTPVARRLTAVLLADIVGYSRLMSRDEDATHERIARHARELIEPIIFKYVGRFVRSMGDSMLVEFGSALNAVRCGLDIQRGLAERQGDEADRIQLRIGINTGDVLVDDRDIYGTSVNITARLEALAAPGTVCVSQSIRDQTRSQPDLFFADRGSHNVKNIDYPISVYEVAYEPIRVPLLSRMLTHRVGISVAATVGTILLASGAALLVDSKNVVVARTNSIIVLPFKNVSGDAADDYLADAITDDLTTDLSRLRRSWVIASGTAFTYKGKTTDPRDVGRDLHVRYALEGTVKRVGSFVQVNAQLVDVENGTNIWSDRFRHETSSLLDLQEAMTGRIANSLNDEVAKASSRHEVGTLAADGNPLDREMRAMAAYTGYPTPEKSLETRRQAEAGLQADPDNARLWGLLANVLSSDVLNAWNQAGPAEVDRAEEAARNAIKLDPNTVLAHYALGFVQRLRGDHQASAAEFEQATKLDANLAKGYAQWANALVFTGDPKAAIPLADKAADLSPKDPSFGVFRWVKGRAYFVLADYPQAITALEESVAVRPNLWFSRAWLIAAYALSGRNDNAAAARDEFIQKFPQYNRAWIADIYGKENQYNNATLQTASAELLKGLERAKLP